MVLDAQNPIPLYFQLKNIIENQISSGELKPGDKIPSENKLCEQYQVSRTTARQAITDLVNSGKIVRTQGRGSFVAQYPISKPPYRLTGFSADMKKQGFHPSSKILELRVMMPTPDIARLMRISPSEAIIFLKRLRYIDGHVMGIEYTHMPFNRFSGLLEENLEDNSLYETLINKFNTVPTRVAITFEAVLCDEDLCELLHANRETPSLHISDITFDQNDRLIEYSTTFYRGDRYTFQVEINKHQNENLLFVSKGFENNGSNDNPKKE
jgi:GntR family transcriptional regulator